MRWYLNGDTIKIYKRFLLLKNNKYRYLKKNYEYNNKKATIKANNPVASAKAKPKIAYANNCGLNWGFLAVAVIKPENTTPIPTPAPASPIVAKPAPMYFAAANINYHLYEYKIHRQCQ